MFRLPPLKIPALLVWLLPAMVFGQQAVLPDWTLLDPSQKDLMVRQIPQHLKTTLPNMENLRYLVLELAEDWSPAWKEAAFDLKSLIVTAKTLGPNVKVGIQAGKSQIDGLLANELAAYIDGYLYDEEPYIPETDQTGKLWQKAEVAEAEVLNTLVDASSLGIELVLFSKVTLSEEHLRFLNVINGTRTGSLDIQPVIAFFPQKRAQFFFDSEGGKYHLALYANPGERQSVSFSLAKGTKVRLIYPDAVRFAANQYGKRTELRLNGKAAYYFFSLEPAERNAQSASIEIVQKKTIDPYELVVKNQVFKDSQDQKINSLMVDEEQSYRYQVPNGISIDLLYRDTIIQRVDQPVERLRREIFIGGAKWPYKKKPELPLIQPDKVRIVPLVVNLDKTYDYTYKGEDKVKGRKSWKVRFVPQGEGNFFTGTVWIDQETGAHLKVTTLQTGLEAPVTANDVTLYYGWVEDEGKRYWAQIQEKALQVLNIAGERVALQIESKRSNFRYNREEIGKILEEAYASDDTILRDTDEGYRYMVKKDGKRVVGENNLTRARAIAGGFFKDPSSDLIPLAGYNYTTLDFMKRGYQANFLIAGAVNDLIISNPDFLGKGWDLTGELFATAIYLENTRYDGVEEVEELAVKRLRESFNLTLGMPINGFFKFSLNYALRYWAFKEGDKMNDEGENNEPPIYPYVLPENTLEHIGRLNLVFSWKRFTSNLQYEAAKRSSWEEFGLVENPDPLFDSYRTLKFNASVSKKLPYFQDITANVRYLKGWDQDRFSRFGFGYFENRVPGFGSSGVVADEAYRLGLRYQIGIADLFNLELKVTGARAILNEPDPNPDFIQLEEVDLYGAGLAANFIGPWRTLLRLDVGYGIDSDLEGHAGEISGQIVFLKLF